MRRRIGVVRFALYVRVAFSDTPAEQWRFIA